MKQFLMIATFLFSINTWAEVTPEQIFGGILDLIKTKIEEDKKDQEISYGPGVLLKDLGDQLALGRLRFTLKDNTSVFTLPPCKDSKNKVVSDLRFRVAGADVYVERIRITYQNGDTENVKVNDSYQENTASGWYQVAGGARCVKAIAVKASPIVNSFGLSPVPGGWPGHGSQHPPFGPGQKSEAVLTFLGFKIKGSGF